MSTTTPKLGLFKYDTTTDGKETFSINQALNANWDIIDNMDPLPDQTGKNGYILTTNGSEASWGQTGEIYPIVETYVDGPSWYRIYSDGWCEQGGYFDGGGTTYNKYTIQLYRAYQDTNYTVLSTIYNEDYTGGTGPYYFGVHSKTVSTFQVYSDSNMQRRMWVTFGYIEV